MSRDINCEGRNPAYKIISILYPFYKGDIKKNVDETIIDRSIIEKAISKTYLKMVCNTIYKKVDEDDNAGKEKAYKSFHILAGYLESKEITGIIYPCTRTKKIIGKNLVLFNRYDAVPIKDSIREIIYK